MTFYWVASKEILPEIRPTTCILCKLRNSSEAFPSHRHTWILLETHKDKQTNKHEHKQFFFSKKVFEKFYPKNEQIYWDFEIQKQPSRGVLKKRYSEICRKFTGEHSCQGMISIKLLQLYWNQTSTCVFSYKFAAYFQNIFL